MSPVTIAGHVARVAAGGPDRLALTTTSGRALTYSQLDALVAEFRDRLLQSPCTNRLVATSLPNSVEYVALLLATFSLDWCHVPLLSNITPALRRSLVAALRPGLIVVDDAAADPTSLADLADLADSGDAAADTPVLALSDLLAEPSPAPPGTPSRRPEDVAPSALTDLGINRIMWSSGSSGAPKPIVWRQDKLLRERQRWNHAIGVSQSDIYFCRHPLEVAHATDLHLFSSLLAGATLVLDDVGLDAPQVANLVRQRQVTVMSWLPDHYTELCNVLRGRGPRPLPHLRLAMCGGSKLDTATVDEFVALTGVTIREVYGSTEFGLAMISAPGGPGRQPLQLVTGVEAELQPLQPLGPGDDTVGHLVLRSPDMGDGYLTLGDTLSCTLGDLGVYETGDVVCRTPDGAYRMLGRTGDVLPAADGVVTTGEVDERLWQHCGSRDVVTYQRTDDEGEVSLVCFYAAALGSPESVSHHLQTTLTDVGVAVPFEVHPVDVMPRTPVGKVDKSRLLPLGP